MTISANDSTPVSDLPDRNVLARYLFLSAAFAFLMLLDVKV
jgi:hypothetical protein